MRHEIFLKNVVPVLLRYVEVFYGLYHMTQKEVYVIYFTAYTSGVFI